MDISTINKQVQQESIFLQDLKREVSKVIVGQEDLLEKMLVALLADGHILIEGVPGLAKTLAVKTACGYYRYAYFQSQGRFVLPQTRAGFFQLCAGRRNQPLSRQSTKRSFRSDAGTPSNHWRTNL